MFDITYNANKSYCIVFDNKPQDKKIVTLLLSITIHYLTLRNVIYKYIYIHIIIHIIIMHIINNNLTDDDDDDIARQKRCIDAQANVSSRKFHLCSSTIKTTLFNLYCHSMYTPSLW